MSKSYRKPYSKFSRSDKKDKKFAHKLNRAKTRQVFKSFIDYDDIYVPTKNIETSDIWCFSSDGGNYYVIKPNQSDEKWLHDWYKKVRRK